MFFVLIQAKVRPTGFELKMQF